MAKATNVSRIGRISLKALATAVLERNMQCNKRATVQDSEQFEERAAIMEFDGGMTRVDAGAAAWALMPKAK